MAEPNKDTLAEDRASDFETVFRDLLAPSVKAADGPKVGAPELLEQAQHLLRQDLETQLEANRADGTDLNQISDLHMSELLARVWQGLFEDLGELRREYACLRFFFHSSTCKKAIEQTQIIVNSSREENGPASKKLSTVNLLERLKFRLQREDDKKETYYAKQLPGLTVWQIDYPKKQDSKGKAKKMFIMADFMAVILRCSDLYLQAMTNLQQDNPMLINDWYTQTSRCDTDMRFVYKYIGDIVNHWPNGNKPGPCCQGHSFMFYCDVDAYHCKLDTTGEDIEMPHVNCDVIANTIKVLVDEGFPRALRKMGWSQDLIQEAMANCCVAPSNSGTSPDTFPGQQQLSVHFYWLLKGPYLHTHNLSSQNTDKPKHECANPKQFDFFVHSVLVGLLELIIELAASSDSPDVQSAVFYACLAAACVDPVPYRDLGAVKQVGCTKGKINPTKVNERWQHIQPHKHSGPKVLALKHLAFPDGQIPANLAEASDQQLQALIALAALTNPAIVSPEWMKRTPQLLTLDNGTCRQKSVSICSMCKKIVHQVLKDNPEQPKLQLTADQIQDLKTRTSASFEPNTMHTPVPKRNPFQSGSTRKRNQNEQLVKNHRPKSKGPFVFGDVTFEEFETCMNARREQDVWHKQIESILEWPTTNEQETH